MAGSVNKVLLVGRLGADPEVKFTSGGTAVANLSVATSEQWTKDGEKHERTEWHRVVLWGKLAELAGEYLSKGRQVYIEGSLQTRKWTDKQGNDRYTTEIVGRQMTFLGGGGEGGGDKGERQRGGGRTRGDSAHSYGPPPMGDDDVSF